MTSPIELSRTTRMRAPEERSLVAGVYMSDQLSGAALVVGFASQGRFRRQIRQDGLHFARAGGEHVIHHRERSHQFGACTHREERVPRRRHDDDRPRLRPRELAQQTGVFNQQRIEVSGRDAQRFFLIDCLSAQCGRLGGLANFGSCVQRIAPRQTP